MKYPIARRKPKTHAEYRSSFMKRLACLTSFLIVIVFGSVYGQKVKYKDIYALLSTKQYEAAEPFLKKYVKETADNPNAFLFMGIVYQEKSVKEDILKQTKRMISYMDSAIFFYDKAYKTITAKEIKQNDEYYQAYNRRDLRTGEFGVKLSDIQFDLEKRMEGLRERIDRVKMVKHYFDLTDTLYVRSASLFKTIQTKYPGQKEFYLRSDESTLKSLSVLSDRFDSCKHAFEQYKSSLTLMGKVGYSQNLTLNEIRDVKADGKTAPDLYASEIKAWDFKKFADQSRKAIEEEILPTRAYLVSYDIEINKLRDRLSKDSVSVKSDLTTLIDKLLMDQLKKYDREPLPMEIFSLKVADLDYRSTVLENKKRADSTDLHIALQLVSKELRLLNRLDSIAAKIAGEDLESRALDYDYFVKNTFATTAVLKSFVSAMKDFAEREKVSKEKKLAAKTESLRWIVNGADSVPLFSPASGKRFRPLIILDEKYTAGLYYADSLNPSGYMYTINAARKPDLKVSFPVDKESFPERTVSSSRAICYSDAGDHLFFVLIFCQEPKDDKYTATLAKVYRSDGLAWSMNYQLDFIPKEIAFKPDSGELTVTGEGSRQSIIDKNGQLVR